MTENAASARLEVIREAQASGTQYGHLCQAIDKILALNEVLVSRVSALEKALQEKTKPP
jgi:hypothetical protein